MILLQMQLSVDRIEPEGYEAFYQKRLDDSLHLSYENTGFVETK